MVLLLQFLFLLVGNREIFLLSSLVLGELNGFPDALRASFVCRHHRQILGEKWLTGERCIGGTWFPVLLLLMVSFSRLITLAVCTSQNLVLNVVELLPPKDNLINSYHTFGRSQSPRLS